MSYYDDLKRGDGMKPFAVTLAGTCRTTTPWMTLRSVALIVWVQPLPNVAQEEPWKALRSMIYTQERTLLLVDWLLTSESCCCFTRYLKIKLDANV
jgi:uncharacterized membrane protein YbhN (UPF0104 family)